MGSFIYKTASFLISKHQIIQKHIVYFYLYLIKLVYQNMRISYKYLRKANNNEKKQLVTFWDGGHSHPPLIDCTSKESCKLKHKKKFK